MTIALEEMGLAYRLITIDVTRGEQYSPEFLRLNPNSKIPAIVDPEPAGGGEPCCVFESGAILIYLAEKTGRFLPSSPRERTAVLQWLMWQMAGLGPMLGQAHHFLHYAPEPVPYATRRYVNVSCATDPSYVGIIRSPIWPAGPGWRTGACSNRSSKIFRPSRPGFGAWWNGPRFSGQ